MQLDAAAGPSLLSIYSGARHGPRPSAVWVQASTRHVRYTVQTSANWDYKQWKMTKSYVLIMPSIPSFEESCATHYIIGLCEKTEKRRSPHLAGKCWAWNAEISAFGRQSVKDIAILVYQSTYVQFW